MDTSSFDYIIIGAGAAGLMLATAMIKDEFFSEKSILLLDKSAKKTNDRTWCFWEKGVGQFDDILFKKWDHIYFKGKDFSNRFTIAPYTYKMIQGIDFYEYAFQKISTSAQVTFLQTEVLHMEDTGEEVLVTTANKSYVGQQVFNSIFNYDMVTNQNKYPVLQQHFLGWIVQTKEPVFNSEVATYMDFSITQDNNTRFMYVLPFAKNKALIEYTLFSEDLLPKKDYEKAIKDYLIENLGVTSYNIEATEGGSIPMTSFDFKEHNTKNILNIGTAGGWAKPSTGYTFVSTAKKIPQLINHLKADKPVFNLNFKNRFWYYDVLFLDVLHHDNGKGFYIFETLFKNRNAQLIFKFLDEETSVFEDIKFIWGCPKMPFIKALFRRIF